MEVNVEVEDWCFLNVGGLHIVFVNCNESSPYNDYVLKIPLISKGDLMENYYNYDVYVLERFMKRWFSNNFIQNVDYYCIISDVAISALIRKIAVPMRKRIASFAYLEKNLMKIPSKMERLSSSGVIVNVLSIELKVKCGLSSSSPFVKQSRRLKYTYSRLAMTQVKKSKKEQRINYRKVMAEREYRPQDLCSDNFSTICSSLVILLNNPQNNFKVSLNGSHVYGCGKHDMTGMTSACNELFSRCEDLSPRSPRFVIDVVAKIFVTNDVLRKLHHLQSLDLIDSEGAAIIYSRLVELVSTAKEADEFILNRLKYSDFGADYLPALAELFPLYPPFEHDSAAPSLPSSVPTSSAGSCRDETLHALWNIRNLSVDSSMTENEVRERSNRAFAEIASLSAAACRDILIIWFMALIAKDASVIVSLQCVSDIDGKVARNEMRMGRDTACSLDSGALSCEVIPLQEGEAGRIRLFVSDQWSTAFVYNLGLIDLGMKPLDKIRRRYFEEELLVHEMQDWLHSLV